MTARRDVAANGAPHRAPATARLRTALTSRTVGTPGKRTPAPPPEWIAVHGRTRLFVATIGFLGATLVALALLAVIGFVSLRVDLFSLNERCQRAAFSCGVLGGLLVSLVPIIIAVLTLLLWRLRRVRKRYQTLAKTVPQRLVQTTLVPERIVGRNDLCDVIQHSLADRRSRRAHVLVGGVGAGKTAVMVRLTSRLAEAGAVPIPVRLRDARERLDFVELARERFGREVEPHLLSADEGDKIWRELLEQDRIVVLADGLEEALVDGELEGSRDTAIRAAVAQAQERRLPLVITSRPHDALRYLDAAQLHVEPLPESAAARYIREGRTEANPKIDLIVERAEVVETPLYMRIARELHEAGELRDLDTRLVTRLALRVRLLDAWLAAVEGSKIHPGVAVSPADRRQALEDLQALACVGLALDTLEVSFATLTESPQPRRRRRASQSSARYEELLAGERRDVRFAASVGARVELVEPLASGVRFRHSIMQAYLGSKALPRVLDETDYLDRALRGHESQGPGRELIMALVMLSFSDTRWRERIQHELMTRARTASPAKAVDMVAAAVEIGGMRASETAGDVTEPTRAGRNGAPTPKQLAAIWTPRRDRETEEAKLRATSRLGELGRGEPRGLEQARATGRTLPPPAGQPIARSAHQTLQWIAEGDQCYAVRLAAAQQIGAGGSAALAGLRNNFQSALQAAQAGLRGGRRVSDPVLLRQFALQGWILPTLAGTVDSEKDAEEVTQLIRDWVALLQTDTQLSVEISWAQGFKYEANRRGRDVNLEMRDFLFEQAESLNETTTFWFTRLSLLHAFTLWALEATRQETMSAALPTHEDGPAPSRLHDLSQRARGEVADASAKRRVGSWVGPTPHPFVAEAARLCEQALAYHKPGAYLWIDETGVISKLGPRIASRDDLADSRAWISPAAGWLALDGDAQRLVADIVLLLNLAERGPEATREQRLKRTMANGALPACLTVPSGRAHMQIAAEGSARSPRPGSSCRAGCEGRFCPYAVPGDSPFRGEFSEAFCRRQRQLLGQKGRTAPWQGRARASSPRSGRTWSGAPASRRSAPRC